MKTLTINTSSRCELVDITSRVAGIILQEKISGGVCLLFSPHTTAGLTINENADPCVKNDIINHLEKLVPAGKNFSHLEGNSDSHIKASLMGFSLNVIIEQGKLVLGTWQGIYFCEFDGPRSRKVYLKIIRE